MSPMCLSLKDSMGHQHSSRNQNPMHVTSSSRRHKDMCMTEADENIAPGVPSSENANPRVDKISHKSRAPGVSGGPQTSKLSFGISTILGEEGPVKPVPLKLSVDTLESDKDRASEDRQQPPLSPQCSPQEKSPFARGTDGVTAAGRFFCAMSPGLVASNGQLGFMAAAAAAAAGGFGGLPPGPYQFFPPGVIKVPAHRPGPYGPPSALGVGGPMMFPWMQERKDRLTGKTLVLNEL